MSSDEYAARGSSEPEDDSLPIEPETPGEMNEPQAELTGELPEETVEDNASSTVLLSQIRETLVEEDRINDRRKPHGLRGWFSGLFNRRVSPEPAPLPVEVDIPTVDDGLEGEDASEMIGDFPVYGTKDPLFSYDFDQEYPADQPDLADQTGEPHNLTDDDFISAEAGANNANPEFQEPDADHKQPVEDGDDNPEWKSFLSRFLKTIEKEPEKQLDDDDLQDRLQRSMGDDTSSGVDAWLASLHEQEGEGEAAPAQADFGQDWLDVPAPAVSETGDDEQKPDPETSDDDLNQLRSQIFLEDDPDAALEADGFAVAASIQVEEEREVPVEDRLPVFQEPSTGIHRTESDDSFRAIDDNTEVQLPSFSEEHPEIFGLAEEETGEEAADLRDIALEDYEAPPSTGEIIHPEKTGTALERFAGWISERSRPERFLLYSAMFVGFVVIVLLSAMALQNLIPGLRPGSVPPPAAVANVPPGSAPYPIRLVLTGGWPFDLNRGAVQDGKWEPQSNEWLEGTELRRVVGLRYNPQLEAVAGSLKKGDEISLIISNADTITYKVDEIKKVDTRDTSIFTGTRPSLVIVLFDQDSIQRLVIVCTQ